MLMHHLQRTLLVTALGISLAGCGFSLDLFRQDTPPPATATGAVSQPEQAAEGPLLERPGQPVMVGEDGNRPPRSAATAR